MSTYTDHNCTCNQVWRWHFSMLFIEHIVDNKAKYPSYSTRDIHDSNWRFKCDPLDCIYGLIWPLSSDVNKICTFFIEEFLQANNKHRFQTFQTTVGNSLSATQILTYSTIFNLKYYHLFFNKFIIQFIHSIQSNIQQKIYNSIIQSTMCYLPMPLLKLTVGIGAIVSGLLSLGLLALTIFANVEKSAIIDQTDKQFINDFLIAMYVISIFFLVLSMGGIYGAVKTKGKSSKAGNCLLSTYFIGVFIFFLVFAASSVILFAAPVSIFGDDCTKGSKTLLIENLYNISQDAYENFCSEKCPCLINSTNQGSYLAGWLVQNNKIFGTQQANFTTYRKYQDCMTNKSSEGDAILMSTLEQFLGCGGWCPNVSAPNYLQFTDINDCVTSECLKNKNTCYDDFKDFTIHKGLIMGVGCTIATVICLANMIMICCICYHPNNKGKEIKNFYSRMMQS